MKKSICLMVLICAFALTSTAQTTRTTSYVRSGQNATLDLNWTADNYGAVQWQESTDDGETWTDISGATDKTYTFKTSSSALYRAHIIGDPACPEVNLEREIVPVNFTVNTSNITNCSVDMEVVNLDVGDGEIVEYGYAVNLSALSRNYDEMPLTKVGEKIEGTSVTFTCTGLSANSAYSMRFYFKTADGSVVIGGSKIVNTLAGLEWSSENWTITTSSLRGAFTFEGSATATGITVKYGPTLNSLSTIAYTYDEDEDIYYTSLLSNLQPATTYYLQVTASVDSQQQTITKEVKTFTDYSSYAVDQSVTPVHHSISWGIPRTLVEISDPSMNATEYPRVCRLANGDLLLTYHGGTVSDWWVDSYYRISEDNGESWSDQVKIFDHSISMLGSGYYRICNPQATVLDNGAVILSATANGNPETNENCKVICCISYDNARTWSDPIIVGRGRTWEPHVVQLPGGELELLVSSEADWWNGSSASDQEIVYSRSSDYGQTWTAFERAAYYKGGRDGMPVATVMQGNKGVIFIIETPSGGKRPSFVHRDLTGEWDSNAWNGVDSDNRWATSLNSSGGGPYAIQLTSGEFVFVCHTNSVGSVWQTSRPQVGLADNTGHNFSSTSTPLTTGSPLSSSEGAYYNSLWQKDEDHIWLLVTRVTYSGSTRGNSTIEYIEGTLTAE